ncbi:MAG TPA: 30S ribosomal protein S20 [Desulfosalsimonadaceae bacterium]|nr:30S ribosomal protein S20 [Desulfosalsimonadaceae bacterium]
MAHHKSAIKRNRQNQNRRMRNRVVKTQVKTASKKLSQVQKTGDTEAIDRELTRAQSIIDKAAKKGVIHRRTAARKKSRLARSVNRSAAA